MGQAMRETKRFIEMYQGGGFFIVSYIREVDADILPDDRPTNIYAYRFYSMTLDCIIVDGKCSSTAKKSHDRTGWHYIDGVVFRMDNLPDDDDYRMLRESIHCDDWRMAVRCKFGNWEPFNPDEDVIVKTEEQQP